MIRILFFGMLFALFFSNCTKDKAGEMIASDICDSTKLNYCAAIAPILEQKCTLSGCHDGTNPGDFSTYNGTLAKINDGTFEQRVFIQKDMPPFGSPQLTNEELQKISAWIELGAPQN